MIETRDGRAAVLGAEIPLPLGDIGDWDSEQRAMLLSDMWFEDFSPDSPGPGPGSGSVGRLSPLGRRRRGR